MSPLATLIDIYSLVVLAAVVMSWMQVDPRGPLANVVNSLTEPVLGPLRSVLPTAGGLDFSPMVLLFLLQMLKGLV